VLIKYLKALLFKYYIYLNSKYCNSSITKTYKPYRRCIIRCLGFMDIKEHAEEVWFIVMLVLVLIFFSWNVYYLSTGKSFSLDYGLPTYSGLPEQAQKAVQYFDSHPPSPGQYSEVINGMLVVNLTATQYKWTPDLIVVNKSEPVVLIINSPQVDTGFYLRTPDGVINLNNVAGITSYAYFVINQPGNYTWRDAEYAGYNSSYMTGTVEVVG